jgi:hypothetical protein
MTLDELMAEPVPIGPSGEPCDATIVELPARAGWRLAWFDGQYTSPPWGPTWPPSRVRDAIHAAQVLNRRMRGE